MQDSYQPYPELYFPQTPALPPPKPVRIEEIMRLLLFTMLAIYAVCHMLFLPFEMLLIALCTDPVLQSGLYGLCALLAFKYICVLVMFYCVYHHDKIWRSHSHWDLYLFALLCLVSTGAFAVGALLADGALRQVGFGSLLNHPFFYDFIGYELCGVLGVIYMVYMACTKDPVQYISVPTYQTTEEAMEPIRPTQKQPVNPMIQLPVYYVMNQ